MTKNILMRIGILAISGLILIGAGLKTYMLVEVEDESVIKVYIEEGETQSVEFENLCMLPGEECEYSIVLNSEKSDKYDLSLDFCETEPKTLKDFAYVRIETEGETICDDLLANVFENEAIILSVDFTEKENTELKIIYYLPIEVGNEAQNAEAVFELIITAINE